MVRRDYPSMPFARLLIYTALQIEARAIAARIDNPSISIKVIGMRASRLPPIDPQAKAIILAGFAGALDPALRCGDVIVDELSTFKLSANNFRIGKIHTADHVVSTVVDKANLFRTTGALAVEMENSIVRAAAAEAKIPFIGVRSISDTADEAIDPAILRIVDEFGNPKPAALASLLIRRPSALAQLNRMRINSKLAAKNLADAVELIVRELPH